MAENIEMRLSDAQQTSFKCRIWLWQLLEEPDWEREREREREREFFVDKQDHKTERERERVNSL